MILTATCVECQHNITIKPDCPTTFLCPVCGYPYFFFNHDIRIKNNTHEYTLPKGNQFFSKDGSPIWTIIQVIESMPPIIEEKLLETPQVFSPEIKEKVAEEKTEIDFPKSSSLLKNIERYKIKRRTGRKSST